MVPQTNKYSRSPLKTVFILLNDTFLSLAIPEVLYAWLPTFLSTYSLTKSELVHSMCVPGVSVTRVSTTPYPDQDILPGVSRSEVLENVLQPQSTFLSICLPITVHLLSFGFGFGLSVRAWLPRGSTVQCKAGKATDEEHQDYCEVSHGRYGDDREDESIGEIGEIGDEVFELLRSCLLLWLIRWRTDKKVDWSGESGDLWLLTCVEWEWSKKSRDRGVVFLMTVSSVPLPNCENCRG